MIAMTTSNSTQVKPCLVRSLPACMAIFSRKGGLNQQIPPTIASQPNASYDAVPFSADEEYGCSVSAYALDSDSVPKSASNVGMELTRNSTAMLIIESFKVYSRHDESVGLLHC